MKKFTLFLKIGLFISVIATFLAISAFSIPEDSRILIQDLLNKYYDSEAQKPSIRSYELKVTNTGFCRYRKVYTNGKEELFVFNLARLKSVNYYGDTGKGELWLNTRNDDVIVQTRRDKNGDIDSMATYLSIPLKNIEVEQLNELSKQLTQLSQSDH